MIWQIQWLVRHIVDALVFYLRRTQTKKIIKLGLSPPPPFFMEWQIKHNLFLEARYYNLIHLFYCHFSFHNFAVQINNKIFWTKMNYIPDLVLYITLSITYAVFQFFNNVYICEKCCQRVTLGWDFWILRIYHCFGA